LTRDSDGEQTLTSNFHGGSWMDVPPSDLWESTGVGGTPGISPVDEVQPRGKDGGFTGGHDSGGGRADSGSATDQTSRNSQQREDGHESESQGGRSESESQSPWGQP
jgi:hypothetical protein